MKHLLLSLIFILPACAQTKWLRKEHTTKSGVISYRNDGGFSVASQTKADNEIKSFCSGDYVTLAEGESTSSGGMVASGNVLIPVVHNWIYLEFACKTDSITANN